MNLGLHAIEAISVHSRESGNPGAENSAKDWVPASAGTNGTEERFKLISSCSSARFLFLQTRTVRSAIRLEDCLLPALAKYCCGDV
jgi:hypothetical protein